MSGYVEEVFWSEIQRDIHAQGLTISPDAAEQVRAVVIETVQYLQRGNNISVAARARLKRFLTRIILNARRAGSNEITAAAVDQSRRQSGSFIVPQLHRQ